MEQEGDVQLINKILSDDDNAFSVLVQRYQNGIHALAWRKIGDFHYAEEITQDTFLKAYENLSTLKNPNHFAGWLYVIANRLCINWVQRSKPVMRSLEGMSVKEIEQTYYSHYVTEQRGAKAAEHLHQRVKKLLENLPESERTVITLYYLGEMTTKEIGKFLGVSVNTITSRLQRARKRLQDDQERLIQEVLGSVRVSAGLSQNIMRQVADMKPGPPSVGKPLLPWAAFGTATLLIVLLLGASNRYLTRFQKPYSFEAQSEVTIEIVDTAIVLDIDSKPAVRNQAGRAAIRSENSGVGLQASEKVSVSNTRENSFIPSTSQWTQASGPQGSSVSEIFVTSEGDLYTATATGIYNLTADATAWTLINASVPTENLRMPMAEHGDTLYIVSNNEVFASVDGGETWNALGPRPEGNAIGLIIVEEAHGNSLHAMYLALQSRGVFRSTDAGAQWTHLDNGLSDKRIYAVTAVENTVFAGTNEGLYRLNSDVWEQLSVEASNAVHSLAVMENNLYVVTGPDPFVFEKGKSSVHIVRRETAIPWKIFHSTDLGASWAEITPKNKTDVMMVPRGVKILAAGKILLALDGILSFRSNDGGQTWTDLGFDRDPVRQNIFLAVALDESTFFKAGAFGVHRTIDGSNSWHPFMARIIGTSIRSLTAFSDKLYAHTGSEIVQSTDGGESWKSVPVDVSEDTLASIEQEHPHLNFSSNSKLAIADGVLYAVLPEKNNLRFFRLSTNNNVLISLQEIPAFDRETLSTELWTVIAEAEQVDLPDDVKKDEKAVRALRGLATFVTAGGLAVSDKTFYVEYQRSLFKWKSGDLEWTDTGLIDLGKLPDEDSINEFKVAALGETVYVEKRDGKLLQSLDQGTSWRDITPHLPFGFTHFKEIVFVGSTVYVATDNGVLSSQRGEHWRVVTDRVGTRIVLDRFVVGGMTVYGAGDTGLYRLGTRGHWKQISPNIPDRILSLVVSDDRLYIATQQHGMFHISLEEESYSELSQK